MPSLIVFVAFCFLARSEDVLVLTDSNFDEAIKENEYILVKFYAPWCGHCKALAPEYEMAAGKLKDGEPKIVLAKMDATEQKEIPTRFGVNGYPTLKFFRSGSHIDYTGGRKADDIVKWVRTKSQTSIPTMNSSSELNSLVSENDVVVVAFIKSGSEDVLAELKDAALSVDDIPFALVTDDAIIEEYQVGSDRKVVLFKKFDENRSDYSGLLKADQILKFVQKERHPLVYDFTPEAAGKIFSSSIKHHVLAFARKSDEKKDIKPELLTTAKKFKGQVHAVYIDVDSDDNKRFLEFFGVEETSIPCVRAIHLSDEEITKYKPTSEGVKSSDLDSFVAGVLDGSIKPHYLSEEIPDQDTKDVVKKIVGKNFDDVAYDSKKTVFVMFYAPWCGHCKSLHPIYEKLAEHFKDDPDIVIANIDSTKNELENIKIKGFPTLKMFLKDTNEVKDYNGERTLEGMIAFIESGGKAPPESDKSTGDDEEEDQRDEL